MGVLSSLLWVFAGGGVLARESGSGSFRERAWKVFYSPKEEWISKHTNDKIEADVWHFVRYTKNWPDIVKSLSKYLDPEDDYTKWLFGVVNSKKECQAWVKNGKTYYDGRIKHAKHLLLAANGLASDIKAAHGNIRTGDDEEDRFRYYIEKILRAKGVDPFWIIEHETAIRIRLELLEEQHYASIGKQGLHKRIVADRLSYEHEEKLSKKYPDFVDRMAERWGMDHLLSRSDLIEFPNNDDKYYGLRTNEIRIYDASSFLGQ